MGQRPVVVDVRWLPSGTDLGGLTDVAARCPGDVLVLGAGRRARLTRVAYCGVSRYCLAHAQCPVLAVPPPALASELRRARLPWAFWHRPLTPQQILGDQPRPAA